MGNWRMGWLVPALVLAAGVQAAAAAPAGDVQAKLQRAGQLSEMADGNAGRGDRQSAIVQAYKALKLIDEALAEGADRSFVEPGLRMIQLDLGDWLVAEQRWNEALALFRETASSRGDGYMDYVRVRALKGIIAAEAGLGHRDVARGVLADLIRQGRDMLARDPHNVFLTRQLAEFLEADTFVRYFADN